MSQITREEVLAQKRWRYVRAGREHKKKILDELVELFGYHRKAAIRALRTQPKVQGSYIIGRPKEYDPDKLLVPLKAIWLQALQPCGVRLKAALPEWLPAYEEDHRKLDADIRESLLAASRATLDRLLKPARIEHRRRATTRRERSSARKSPFARSGPKKVPVTWKWTRSLYAVALWMIDMPGCSTAWTS